MNNLHITLNEFRNASRVIKETNSILNETEIEKVFVAALYGEGVEEDEVLGEVRVKRFKLKTRSWSKSLVVQVIKFFEYIFKVIFFYRKKNIGMVNVHALSLLPLGVFLKYFYNAKLVYDAHELETEMNGLGGVRKKLAKFIEKLFIMQADLIIVVSPSIADWYANEYEICRPTVVMNSPLLFELAESDLLREKLNIPQDKIIVIYQGGMAKGRGIELLLSAFSQRDDDIVIVFMGAGELKPLIEEKSKENTNIYSLQSVSPDVVLGYTSSADIGIHMIQNTCLNHFYCMPNKFFEYAMSGLPVIVSNMKEMTEFVVRYDMGIVVESDTVNGVNSSIDKLLEKNIDSLKKNARQAAEENSWGVQEQQMLLAYTDLGIRI